MKGLKRFLLALAAVVVIVTVIFCMRLDRGGDAVTEMDASATALPTDAPTVAPTVAPTIAPTEAPRDFSVKITFAGDCMLASFKNQSSANGFKEYAQREKPSYFLSKVKQYFEDDDLTVVNLETVLSDRTLTERTKNYTNAFWFRGATSNTEILTCSSVEAVSLANNHTNDYGSEGIKDTIAAVEDAGLLYGNESQTFYFEKNGFRIAVICSGLWYGGEEEKIVKRLKAEEGKSDYQIVFYHGGTEGLHKPEAWKVNASHKIVDAGADLVIGNHPHVLQPREIYKGVEIIYSIANFCYGGNKRPEKQTMIYRMELTVSPEDKVTAERSEIIPCYVYTGSVNNFQPAPITNENEKQKIWDFMDGKRDLPY